jgi:hypothetical protein
MHPGTLGCMAEKQERRFDMPWIVAAVVAVALLLITPRLAADTTGRVSTAVLLLIMFAALVYGLSERIAFRTISFWLIVVALGLVEIWFGSFVWPYTLVVSPSIVKFPSMFSGGPLSKDPVYTFRVTNRSDEDIYAAEVDFKADKIGVANDLHLDLPRDSRKPLGDSGGGAQHFVDVTGLLCKDYDLRPLFILSFYKLNPHESREISISYSKHDVVSVSAETGFYTSEPQVKIMDGDKAAQPFRWDHSIGPGGCRVFGFLVDQQGPSWVDGH